MKIKSKFAILTRSSALPLALCLAAALMITSAASAQRGGGPQMSPEDAAAAWKLESGGVAGELGLSADETGKVNAAYADSRKSQGEAFRELMQTAERGPGMFQEMQALNDEERGKLKTALTDAVGAENAGKAIASLGTFNRQWDRLVNVLAKFSLDDANQTKALSLIKTYVVESDKARNEAIAAMDFQGMRAATQELKGKLDTDIAGALSEEQLATWKTATAQQGRGGGGGRGPR